MKKLIFFDADGEGGGGDTGVKFSASSVSTRLDEIIGQKNSMYTEMSGLTDTVNSKVSNDGTGVLMGAVGDLKADWQAFQFIMNFQINWMLLKKLLFKLEMIMTHSIKVF